MSEKQRNGGFKTVTKVAAPDGTLHDSHKAAVQHMKDKKVREALEDFKLLTSETCSDVSNTPAGSAIYIEHLPAFLFENRADILAALTQDVPVRKKRAPSKPKAVEATANPA